jgi:excisionase family DNA binding protein
MAEPAVARTLEAQAARGLDEYLTAEEFGALVKCSPKSIYRLAKSDPTLPALRLGKLLRFPRKGLERWLASRTQGSGRPRSAAVVKGEAVP